jgi:Lar family restriction alleviation protein
MSELRECPFCGGKPEIERVGNARQSMIVACTNCGARVESGDVAGLTAPANYRWNARADLEEETGCAIYHIEADTREFARKRIEIFLETDDGSLSVRLRETPAAADGSKSRERGGGDV